MAPVWDFFEYEKDSFTGTTARETRCEKWGKDNYPAIPHFLQASE
jgi:hypothetical protein